MHHNYVQLIKQHQFKKGTKHFTSFFLLLLLVAMATDVKKEITAGVKNREV